MERATPPPPGRWAPPDVKAFIRRWFAKPAPERRRVPLLYQILGDGTPLFKLTPDEAFYVARPETGPVSTPPGYGKDGPGTTGYTKGQACGNCRSLFIHATSGLRICDQVRGEVLDTAWCNRWQPPWPVATFRRYQELGRVALK